jgi:hypothetical protein
LLFTFAFLTRAFCLRCVFPRFFHTISLFAHGSTLIGRMRTVFSMNQARFFGRRLWCGSKDSSSIGDPTRAKKETATNDEPDRGRRGQED